MDNEKLKEAVEQAFAKVAGTTPKLHKNVLGDKWKYINAVLPLISPPMVLSEEEIENIGRQHFPMTGIGSGLISFAKAISQATVDKGGGKK